MMMMVLGLVAIAAALMWKWCILLIMIPIRGPRLLIIYQLAPGVIMSNFALPVGTCYIRLCDLYCLFAVAVTVVVLVVGGVVFNRVLLAQLPFLLLFSALCARKLKWALILPNSFILPSRSGLILWFVKRSSKQFFLFSA